MYVSVMWYIWSIIYVGYNTTTLQNIYNNVTHIPVRVKMNGYSDKKYSFTELIRVDTQQANEYTLYKRESLTYVNSKHYYKVKLYFSLNTVAF